MTEPTVILFVHPDDVNLADVKALAAKRGATAIGSDHIPRGRAFIADPKALTIT